LARTYCMEAQGEVVEPQLELSVPLVATYQTLAAFAGGAETINNPAPTNAVAKVKSVF